MEKIADIVENQVKSAIMQFGLDPDQTWVEALQVFHQTRRGVTKTLIEEQISALLNIQRAQLEEVEITTTVYNKAALAEYNSVSSRAFTSSLAEREVQDLMLILHCENDLLMEELFAISCCLPTNSFSSFREWFIGCFCLFLNRLILANF